ncbi:two-component sensor histidine kinase [Sphaerisporangium krabiense]|uniref:histidine kinase n=1 Tax=Sphaerisporangium krabiense TaxID=763782 RepID=A0A7W8Z2G5_9ACTN|nr:HAMP domain-containing sensor histidine kinase [Sphaerisporangium krabiense]MBB5626165.1 signal transduction histidine kinase [Sphaerisporangium krabiense]GII66168.1 two-component sensor histidine kinase [Sphaerisporangium krabiense]
MNARHGRSITRRITVFTGLVAAVLSTLMAVALMAALQRYATAKLTEEVRATAGRVALKAEHGQVDPVLTVRPFRDVQIVDQHGRVVASTPALRGKPPMATFTPDGEGTRAQVVCGGAAGRDRCSIVVAQSAHRPGGDWIVYTASPRPPLWTDPGLAALVGASVVLLTLAVAYLGNRIVTRSLRPVDAIRTELDEINASCPGRRVPAPSDTEIHDLADSINHTLTRLQGAMEQQRQFASAASHDLRSPITAMRAEAEDAMLAPRQTSVPALAGAILEGLDRLESIVCDLLTIARLESGVPAERDPVDLVEMVVEECRMRHQTTKKIICHLEPGVVVLGDRIRLGRLFTNLLDNADRHAESMITVVVAHGDASGEGFPHGAAVLEVLDDGPGIDPDKRELVFQRFARLDQARAKDAGGTGLGLAIARQIAESHGGTLRIKDSPTGARFVLRLPRHPDHSTPAARAGS